MSQSKFYDQRAEDLDTLEPLLGRWTVTGEATGSVTYEWLPGKHFMLQKVELTQNGEHIQGLEVIGHIKPFGEDRDPLIRSRFYDSAGNTLDYVYRLEGDQLTIWAGEQDSPFLFQGTIDVLHGKMSGRWDYAGEGGYSCEMKRIDV